MKTTRIIFWISTTLIFLFEGVMPALTSQTEMALEGIRHLGYPDYFGPMITAFKVAGSLAIILPKVPARLKEWAYAGFVFDFLCASISTTVVDGFGFGSVFPLIVLAVLMVSYVTYHKLNAVDQRHAY
ncbi:DoxX family protein [Dyadobacter chenwenxiniae]|uniref:DoxX family protein n=1 Tax=Dyadobacter chenwenxiniae TaxID=2906456 RepID=A0A9X1PLV4_9BACT|nr:DoxX family protein [Dyadobacter chenwenxiniae]MCF0052057.1 DoxX family protein [Dyadobacter chenwenxiniae]MCF0062795.1 DoxX family protein [Dyadobacter chenwenxiniae]UON85030.1 DoxX family protein [Dyadobacter chenwenxiniae]